MEDANEFAMEGPPTPCTQKRRLEREDEREMTETDQGRTRGGLHAALLATNNRV